MKSHFFAFMSRMKLINRWSLMRNTTKENIAEHSLQVAIIAHALAIIKNRVFGGNARPEKAAVLALYHDASEIFTGDLPTPVKYYNPSIKDAYKQIEFESSKKLLSMLPDELCIDFEKLLIPKKDEHLELVKAADKISAYLKCLEECAGGNEEFAKAAVATKEACDKFNLPEVKYFLDMFSGSFSLTLDEMEY